MDITSLDDQIDLAMRAAAAYYEGREPLLTDAEYDALIERISTAADADGELAGRPDVRALLTKVAAGSAAGDVVHSRPMLSLEKVRTEADLARFLRRLKGDYVVEAKLDGSAVAAHYEAGELVRVLTRGDGVTGQDVTARTRNIFGLPIRLSRPLTGEVRGEVYMTADDFAVSQAGRTGAGHEPFSNPRNATAGLITRPEDPGYAVAMSFVAYDIDLDEPGDLSDDSHTVRMSAGRALGLRVPSQVVDTEGMSIERALTVIKEVREGGTHPIDGAVIKADSYAEREHLGEGSRAPRWAVAYKYDAEKATTVLTGIERTVGRTGNIAYTALLEPVEVDGSMVSKATLHNGAFITERDLRIGDTVEVYKAGDIIPRVERALTGLRPEGSVPYEAPTTCPTCQEELDISGAIWRCTTPSCSVAAALDYALSRDALDVDGFSVKVAEAVAEAELASDMGDLFSLTADQLADLPMGTTKTGSVRRLGRANATRIAEGIERAKSQPLARVITALGVRGTGRGVSRRLAAHFGSLDALYAATAEELAATPMGTYSSTGTALTLGPAKAQLIATQLASTHYRTILAKLKAAGVTVEEQAADAPDGAPLEGMNVVVTGAMKGTRLDGLSRGEMNELIENAGGRASSSVSKTTSLLVCAGEGSSKHRKAVELGVRIVSPDEFAEMVGR